MSQFYKDALLQLLPVNFEGIDEDVTAEGVAFDVVNSVMDQMYINANPLNLDDLSYIAAWELALNISSSPSDTLETRKNRIVAKLKEKGSLRCAYYVSIAAALGYQVVVKECQPLMPGIMRAGDTCYTVDGFYTIRVLVFGKSGPQTELESVFNRLRPAEGIFEYKYENGTV